LQAENRPVSHASNEHVGRQEFAPISAPVRQEISWSIKSILNAYRSERHRRSKNIVILFLLASAVTITEKPTIM
jgi:hypothetical protein